MLTIIVLLFVVVFLLAGLLWTALQPLYHDREALFDEFEHTHIFCILRILAFLPAVVLLIMFAIYMLTYGFSTLPFSLSYVALLSGLLLVALLFLFILLLLMRLWGRLPVMPVVGLLCTLPIIIYLAPVERVQAISHNFGPDGYVAPLLAGLALLALWYLLLWQTSKRLYQVYADRKGVL